MYYLNKIKEHLHNWCEYAKEHLVRILFILIIFLIACMAFCYFPKSNILEGNIIVEQHVLIFGITLENWFTYISLLALIIAAIWAIYQFDKSTARKQQEKASEIAQEFSNNLIEKFSIISGVLLKNQEMKKMIAKISNSKLDSFTSVEIIEIVKDSLCFQKYSQIINSKRTQKRYIHILNKFYNKNEQSKFNSSFPLLVENTLNQLEAICINISSQAAGSEFIYNSLHQSFLHFVEVMAIKISTNNHNNVDKYFTHIIQVYNMWNTQKEKDIAKFEKTERKINKLKGKATKEINKLLKKKNKTV